MNTNLFIKNKYANYYFNIITKSKQQNQNPNVYYEKHHIIPKSLGGNNSKSNLVLLTAKQHFICHILLTKMTENDNKRRMVYALHSMGMKNNHTRNRYINSRHYERNKIALSAYMSEQSTNKNPMNNLIHRETHYIAIQRRGATEGTTGLKHSDETKIKMSKAHSGKTLSDETKKKLSNYNKLLWEERRKLGIDKRKPLSEETKRKISESLRNRKK